MALEGKELGDEKLSQVTGGRAMSGYIEHTVCRGETVATIAQKYHVTEREILGLNGALVSGTLFMGQILKVPVHIRC